MPEANKIKQDEVMVDIDTSGPENINIGRTLCQKQIK